MTAKVKFLLVQYAKDPLRKEPRNVGIVAQLGARVFTKFIGFDEDSSTIDGRKLRQFGSPDAYKQWVYYWQKTATMVKSIDELAADNSANYFVVEGGEVTNFSPDSLEDVVHHVFTRYVSGSGYAEAMEASQPESGAHSFEAEIESVFKEKNLIEENERTYNYPFPIVQHRSFSGQSRVTHYPQYVQQNGRVYVMESFDFSSARKLKSQGEHAGFKAYMFLDLKKSLGGQIEPISILRIPDEFRNDKRVEDAKLMLEAESRIIDWYHIEERTSFLAEREKVARGEY